jgi:hypothetical protein
MLYFREMPREGQAQMGETHLDVSAYAALVGKDLPQPGQFNYDVTRDGIRHFAYCIPNPNALYLDQGYRRDHSLTRRYCAARLSLPTSYPLGCGRCQA